MPSFTSTLFLQIFNCSSRVNIAFGYYKIGAKVNVLPGQRPWGNCENRRGEKSNTSTFEDSDLFLFGFQKKMNRSLEHAPIFSKIRSVISLLKLWYAAQPSDDIISLGVCSDGKLYFLSQGAGKKYLTIMEDGIYYSIDFRDSIGWPFGTFFVGSFDIPAGIVFSQPVMLDPKSRWVPFTEFPLINDFTRRKINECVKSTSPVLKEFGLLHHVCKDDVDICSNPDCPMNFDNVMQSL